MDSESLLWPARAFIYAHFAATARAPLAAEVAREFGLTVGEAEAVLRALHERHALFLEPGTARIRMANPFSAIETPFQTTVAGKTYFANCAWDTFGVAAALQVDDAEIRSVCAASGAPIRLRVAGGAVVSADQAAGAEETANGGAGKRADTQVRPYGIHRGGAVVHFLVPFAHWYDDLVHT